MQQIEGEDDEITKRMSNIVMEPENEEVDIPYEDIPEIDIEDGVVEDDDPVSFQYIYIFLKKFKIKFHFSHDK